MVRKPASPPDRKDLPALQRGWDPLAILLVAALCAGCLLRLFLAVKAPHQVTVYDDQSYLGYALYFARGGTNDPWRPPMHIWFLAYAFRLTASVTGMRLAQALVSCAGLLLVYPVTRMFVSRAAAVISAVVVAFSPEFWMYASVLLTEPLTIFWVLTAVWFSMKSAQRPAFDRRTLLLTLLAGICWGLAALTRDEFMYILLAVAAALWWISGRSWRAAARSAILIGASVLTIAPYTYRNYQEFDAFVPIADNGSYAVWEHWTTVPQSVMGKQFFSWKVGERDDRAIEEAVKALKANPAHVMRNMVRSFCRLWLPDDMLMTAFYDGCFGQPRSKLIAAQYLVVALLISMMLAGYICYLFLYRPQRESLVIHAIILASVALHTIAFGQGRHREPYTPFMVAFAAQAFLAASTWLHTSRRRAILVMGVAVVVAGSCWAVLGGRTRALYRETQARSAQSWKEQRMNSMLTQHFSQLAHISKLWANFYHKRSQGKSPLEPKI